jgi:uncharacterized protein (TIGR01244 family)
MWVSGQIGPGDVAALKQQGVTMILNHRPDGEEPGQPLSSDIEAAAEQAGIDYRFCPIQRGIGPADVECMDEALREAGDGKVLAFCRSGNRSALTWAVTRRQQGASVEQLESAAGRAGFDLAPVAHLL